MSNKVVKEFNWEKFKEIALKVGGALHATGNPKIISGILVRGLVETKDGRDVAIHYVDWDAHKITGTFRGAGGEEWQSRVWDRNGDPIVSTGYNKRYHTTLACQELRLLVEPTVRSFSYRDLVRLLDEGAWFKRRAEHVDPSVYAVTRLEEKGNGFLIDLGTRYRDVGPSELHRDFLLSHHVGGPFTECEVSE